MIYVTYDKTDGTLNGAYIQELLPEHTDCYIEVSPEQHRNWVSYKYDIVMGALVPVPTPAPLLIIRPVTRRQARQALFINGLLDSVPDAIASIEDEQVRKMVEIFWEDSLEFYRDNEYVVSIGAAIGLGEKGLDELFQFASTL